MTPRIKVWDPFVRVFHWSLVTLFALNAFFIEEDGLWHIGIGYAIAALVVCRLIWGFIGSRYARFSSFPPSVVDASNHATEILQGRVRPHTGHTPLGAWMIYNLLLTIAGIAVTGYLLTTDAFWGVEWVTELHETLVAWAELSVLIHIAAVVYESQRTRINLTRAMITGYKATSSIS